MNELLELIRTQALSFGNFTLSSGKQSSYYLDIKKILFNARALELITNSFIYLTADLDFDSCGGLELGAIPLITLVVLRSNRINGFYVRKQTKEHGTKSRVEGTLPKNSRVLILEDALTTGQSVLQVIQEVKKAGANPIAVLAVIDRLEGAHELLDIPIRSIFTIKDIL